MKCVCVCVCVGVIATDAVGERQDIILTSSYGWAMSVVYIPAVFMSDLHSCYGNQRSDCLQPKNTYISHDMDRITTIYIYIYIYGL